MEITLIRHGQPVLELTGQVRSREISKFVRNYNLSGITGEPPYESKQIALKCNVAVCSDLTRSIESAKALGFSRVHLSDPVFREVAIPHFNKGSLTMSVNTWGVLLRGMSVFGFSKNGESLSMAKKRAKIAASALIDMAHSHKSAMLVGHGFINYFIAKELLSRNWSGPSKPGGSYWEYGVYTFAKE